MPALARLPTRLVSLYAPMLTLSLTVFQARERPRSLPQPRRSALGRWRVRARPAAHVPPVQPRCVRRARWAFCGGRQGVRLGSCGCIDL